MGSSLAPQVLDRFERGTTWPHMDTSRELDMNGKTETEGHRRVLEHVAHELGAFEQAIADFQDPSQEWRRLFSELLGTFFLVLVAAGGGMMGQAFPDTISRTAAVVAPGLMVMAIILFMGKVSGAHLNPAVSIAFALCVETSRGGGCRATSSCSSAAPRWRPGSSRPSCTSRRRTARTTRRPASRTATRS